MKLYMNVMPPEQWYQHVAHHEPKNGT